MAASRRCRSSPNKLDRVGGGSTQTRRQEVGASVCSWSPVKETDWKRKRNGGGRDRRGTLRHLCGLRAETVEQMACAVGYETVRVNSDPDRPDVSYPATSSKATLTSKKRETFSSGRWACRAASRGRAELFVGGAR